MKSGKTQLNSDIWLRTAAALFGVFYTVFVGMLSYLSVFYEVVVIDKVVLCIILSVVSILAGCAMFYSRKHILTKITGFILFPLLLPIVLLCFGSWVMIIPLGVCAVFVFFASGANEGAKILLGTIYLMVYILSALAYFILTSFLASPALTEVVEKGVSPSGRYRYEVIDTTDSSNGSTSVIIEPNYMDKDYSVVLFRVKGYGRKLCVKRPKTEVTLEWKDEDLYINDERWFTPYQSVRGKWFEKESRTWDIF